MIRKILCAIVACLLVVGASASLTVDSNDAGYAKPKVAGLDYTQDTSSTNQALMSKFEFVILGNRNGMSSFTGGIHSRNSSEQMAVYSVATELQCSRPSSTSYNYEIWNHVEKYDMWLRKADGTHSQWTTSYGACDMNISQWGRRDGSGYTWPQYKARYDNDHIFRYLPYVKYVFSDNAFDKPRVDADWRRIGTNQLRTDPTIIDAQRAGQVQFWDTLNSLGKKVIGNVDGDLSNSQYRGQLHGAFNEGLMGKSWSIESWGGWSAAMDRFRKTSENTSEHLAFFQVYGEATDYKMMRYGLCSALMVDNGWYLYMQPTGAMKSRWYDEYDAHIGTPLYAAPTAPYPVAQGGDGIYWRRTYSNGLVLVNPSKTQTAHATIPAGYKHLQGTQDPTVNNGQVVTSVTLPPRSGLLLIKN